jgi:UMF1 family MFS transporter
MNSPEKNVSKRHLYGWYLFDFANSILIINGGLYFPQWLVQDHKVSDLWFNSTLVATSVALLVTAPVIGSLADRAGRHGHLLLITSITMFLATMAIAVADIADLSVTWIILPAFLLLMYSYQLSLVFYNALLGTVSKESTLATTSGVGFAAGWLGGIVGIFLVLPFTEGWIAFPHDSGRANAFLPSAIFYLLTIIPALVLLRGSDSIGGLEAPIDEAKPKRLSLIRSLISNKAILLFLICYLLFADPILTIQNNSTIYLEAVMNFGDGTKAGLFILLLCAAAIGSIAISPIARRVSLGRTLAVLLATWTLTVLIISVVSNSVLFVILFGLVGLLFGATWNTSRILFLRLVPPKSRGTYFGFYSAFERFATLLGPLAWSLPVVLMTDAGPFRYRLAFGGMSVFFFMSLIALAIARRHSSVYAEVRR